jgi:hypothetical protein
MSRRELSAIRREDVMLTRTRDRKLESLRRRAAAMARTNTVDDALVLRAAVRSCFRGEGAFNLEWEEHFEAHVALPSRRELRRLEAARANRNTFR